MPNTPDFVAHVLEMMRPTASATARAMFGGHGVYADGRIVGIVVDDELYLKTDATTLPAFTALRLEPFRYSKADRGAVTMSYHRAPDEALESPEAMREWLRGALGAALRGAATKTGNSAGKRRKASARRRRTPPA
ncbi:MAG: TfoX/Sxy family protein [Alphaproteobacteria bacterium]